MARLVLVLLVVVPAVSCGGAIAADWLVPLWQRRQTGSVPVPSATASPDDVVRAFIRAIDAHDDRAIRAMSAPVFIEHYGVPAPAHFRLDKMFRDMPSSSAEAQGDGRLPEISAYRQIVEVPTDVTITEIWSLFPGPNDSGGADTLFFTMVRNSDQDRWLVAEMGHP